MTVNLLKHSSTQLNKANVFKQVVQYQLRQNPTSSALNTILTNCEPKIADLKSKYRESLITYLKTKGIKELV